MSVSDAVAEPGYLNWAAFGPMSPTVRQSAVDDLELLVDGRPGAVAAVRERVGEARAQVAALFDAAIDDVVLHPSTTHALQQAILGVDGGVVASAVDFPAITVPIVRGAQFGGTVVPQWLPVDAEHVTGEAIAAVLTEQTRAVAVSAVDYRTGFRADLAEIRDVIGRDVVLIVDATQAVGAVSLDWAHADVIAGHGYKWLRSGWGTGYGVYRPRARQALIPRLSGITGTVTAEPPYGVRPGLPAVDGQAFSVTAPDPIAASRLAAGIADYRASDPAAIEAEVTARTARLIAIADAHSLPVLTPRAAARRAGIVGITPPGGAGALGAALVNSGVTATVRGDVVRVSAHTWTTECDLALFDEACGQYRSKVA